MYNFKNSKFSHNKLENFGFIAFLNFHSIFHRRHYTLSFITATTAVFGAPFSGA